MRVPFATARFCEEALQEALASLRMALRSPVPVENRPNPFARPMPCPLGDTRRTAKILRIF